MNKYQTTPCAPGHPRWLYPAVLLASSILLNACSTVPSPAPSTQSLAVRQPVASFTATGRVAARTTGDSRRGFSGGFNWSHKPLTDVIELLTPLGQIAARVSLSATGADIELSDGQRTTTADPEQFLSDALGVALPVAALPYWLQAVPLPRVQFRVEADSVGRPARIWQKGWQINYTEYADASAGAHPTRMLLTQGDVEARMIISEWSTP